MSLELACRRALERTAFGKPIANLGGNRERIAEARIAIDSTRLLVLNAAWKLDVGGPLNALSEVAQIKVAAPAMAQKVVDMAMQLHGGGGLSSDFPLAGAWTTARALRLADGPDEVHRGVIARLELMKHSATR
jgi:acyl-CoA dehydrogenase